MDLILNLVSAPNTTNPSLFVLRNKCYQLEVKNIKDEYCLFIAAKGGRRFVGNSAPELLGLVTLWEHLGDNWMEQLSSIPDIVEELNLHSAIGPEPFPGNYLGKATGPLILA